MKTRIASIWNRDLPGKPRTIRQPPDRAQLETKRAILRKLDSKIQASRPLEKDSGFPTD